MKIAYLIAAHENPSHLQLLIAALSSSSATFFIHVDRKSDVTLFTGLRNINVHFTEERISVSWGDFSQVEASLVLLRTALTHDIPFDRFVLLSGVDYPLRSVPYIEAFFMNSPDTQFISLVAMPADTVGKPISRLTTYRPATSQSRFVRVARRLLAATGVWPPRRDYKPVFGQNQPYAGASWWAFTRPACQYILDFSEREAKLVTFFENTVCPDESFFHTIIGNSQFRENLAPSLTYADWSAGGASPCYINKNHLVMFSDKSWFRRETIYGTAETLFARKFNGKSADLVDKLNQQIAERDKSLAVVEIP